MSATRETVREQIEQIEKDIAEAKTAGDGVKVTSLEEQRRSLMVKLTELNEHRGTVLTDSPVDRGQLLKG